MAAAMITPPTTILVVKFHPSGGRRRQWPPIAAPAIGLFGLLESLARFLLSMDALVWTLRFIRRHRFQVAKGESQAYSRPRQLWIFGPKPTRFPQGCQRDNLDRVGDKAKERT